MNDMGPSDDDDDDDLELMREMDGPSKVRACVRAWLPTCCRCRVCHPCAKVFATVHWVLMCNRCHPYAL